MQNKIQELLQFGGTLTSLDEFNKLVEDCDDDLKNANINELESAKALLSIQILSPGSEDANDGDKEGNKTDGKGEAKKQHEEPMDLLDLSDDDTIEEAEVLMGMFCVSSCEKILYCEDKAYAKEGELFHNSKCVKCKTTIDTNYFKHGSVYYCKYFGCNEEMETNCNYVECIACRMQSDGNGRRNKRNKRNTQNSIVPV